MVTRIFHIFMTTSLLLFFIFPSDSGFSAPDKVFEVTSIADTVDDNPGDGECADANGICTLRAAVMEANLHAGADSINLPADIYPLTIENDLFEEEEATTGDLDIIGNLTINGAGAGKTIIDGYGLQDRLLDIKPDSEVTISGVTIYDGYNLAAGGILNRGALVLYECILSSNGAMEGGGIINASNAVLTLTNSTVNNNDAIAGGGILNYGSININNSAIRNNNAEYGGGISNSDGELFINNSTISHNGVIFDGSGGGINISGGTISLTNSTVSGNYSCGSGGGITITGSGKLVGHNITITDNMANAYYYRDDCGSMGNPPSGKGGGIKHISGQVHLHNTIVAQNFLSTQTGTKQTDDCWGILNTLRYSLLGTADNCVYVDDNNIVNQNPKFKPLKDNGGSTQTHALKDNSPAIDAGDPKGCKDQGGKLLTTDQRGFARPFDGDGNGSARCDMGAYELVKFSSFNYLPLLGK